MKVSYKMIFKKMKFFVLYLMNISVQLYNITYQKKIISISLFIFLFLYYFFSLFSKWISIKNSNVYWKCKFHCLQHYKNLSTHAHTTFTCFIITKYSESSWSSIYCPRGLCACEGHDTEYYIMLNARSRSGTSILKRRPTLWTK